jgi:hypothetical protein
MSKPSLQFDKFAQGTTLQIIVLYLFVLGDFQAALFKPVPNDRGGSLGDALPMEVRPFLEDSSKTVDNNGSSSV